MSTATPPVSPSSGLNLPLARVAALVLVMVVGAIAGEWLRPTERLSEIKPAIQLE